MLCFRAAENRPATDSAHTTKKAGLLSRGILYPRDVWCELMTRRTLGCVLCVTEDNHERERRNEPTRYREKSFLDRWSPGDASRPRLRGACRACATDDSSERTRRKSHC